MEIDHFFEYLNLLFLKEQKNKLVIVTTFKGGSIEKSLSINSHHGANLNFPAKELRVFFSFFLKEHNWVPHCKTLAHLTLSDSETEKATSQKGKHRVTGTENSNLLYAENLYTRVSCTEPPLIKSIKTAALILKVATPVYFKILT